MHREIQDKGLSSEKAKKLFEQYGPNEIKSDRRYTLFKSFLNQFNNFLPILLIGAGLISFYLGQNVDSALIFIIVFLNVFFGVYQEFKAEKTLESLKKITLTLVRVIRDGREQEIDSKFLVPGDLIYLEEGSKVPADGKILKSWNLEVNEAALTGESAPIPKSETPLDKNNNVSNGVNIVFMGTSIARGRCYAIIQTTGEKTKFGQIAKSLKEIKEEDTPFQKKLNTFSRQIGFLGMMASILVFALSFIQNKNIYESFLFAVSLAVAAVPEGLPAVMTITLAIGVEKMAKEKAIVRKLNAIEALGAVTLVATDKTGTITTGEMRVKKIWVDNQDFNIQQIKKSTSKALKLMLLNGILCSTATRDIGDPTEVAILRLALEAGLDFDQIKNEWNILEEVPFDTEKKIMTVSVKNKKESILFTKGAPETIISQVSKMLVNNKEVIFDSKSKQDLEKTFKSYAAQGLRLIAFSYNSVFLGFVAIADPVREEVKDSVSQARAAGIKVVMLTGDNELTAENIGIEAGIIQKGQDIITGQGLDRLTDDELLKILPKVKIFARITPEHKLRIVSLFQTLGEIVVVTGDGINDVLALKKADVGVAMGQTGTDAARDTADMIITDDNFASLINAIEHGRNIFSRIKNATKYLLTTNSAEVFSVLIAALLQFPPLLLAIQILYINLVTDGLPALSLSFAPSTDGLMRQLPRKNSDILEKDDFKYILYLGFSGALLTFISFLIGLSLKNTNLARTMAFTTLTLIQPFILLDLWTLHGSLAQKLKVFRNMAFFTAFFMSFILQVFVVYHPMAQIIFKTQSLPIPLLFLALALSLVIIVPIEFVKKKKTANYLTS